MGGGLGRWLLEDKGSDSLIVRGGVGFDNDGVNESLDIVEVGRCDEDPLISLRWDSGTLGTLVSDETSN